MAGARFREERLIEEAACPVSQTTVTVYAAYRLTADGCRCLADFECYERHRCAIPRSDYCPVYVAYQSWAPPGGC